MSKEVNTRNLFWPIVRGFVGGIGRVVTGRRSSPRVEEPQIDPYALVSDTEIDMMNLRAVSQRKALLEKFGGRLSQGQIIITFGDLSDMDLILESGDLQQTFCSLQIIRESCDESGNKIPGEGFIVGVPRNPTMKI